MKKYIFIILIILMCASPVAALTYSEEYYKLGGYSDSLYTHALMSYEKYYSTYDFVVSVEGLISAYELRRQTILLEKQNELQAELVKAQWVNTCYASENTVIMGNLSAWKSECANAGYPVG